MPPNLFRKIRGRRIGKRVRIPHEPVTVTACFFIMPLEIFSGKAKRQLKRPSQETCRISCIDRSVVDANAIFFLRLGVERAVCDHGILVCTDSLFANAMAEWLFCVPRFACGVFFM